MQIYPVRHIISLDVEVPDEHRAIFTPLTNDLRYESKDSREILNCWFSLKAERRMDEEVVDLDEVVPQKLLRSVGEGGRKTPESLISIMW